MIELRLLRGSRMRTYAVADYDGALAKIAELGLPRHEVRFDGFWPGIIAFEAPVAGTAHAPPPPAIADVKTWLIEMARAFGFPLAGITRPQLPEKYTRRFAEWLDSGAHGEMHYLERQKEKRMEPARVARYAKSVLAVATPHSPTRPGNIARYATGRDYHELLSARLHEMKRAIRRVFPGAPLYTSVDTGPVLERAYAEQAGLGWIGKNGVLISRTHGSYLSLATLWTPFELEVDAPHAEFCGTCSDCIQGCPTGAITKPGWVEATRCISYWTIETTGPLPDTHGWLFGCDVCQEVCPWNKFASPVVMDALASRPGPELDWLQASDKDIEARIAQTPLRRVGPAGMRRNARRLLPVID